LTLVLSFKFHLAIPSSNVEKYIRFVKGSFHSRKKASAADQGGKEAKEEAAAT
jgi:hypothetical protein